MVHVILNLLLTSHCCVLDVGNIMPITVPQGIEMQQILGVFLYLHFPLNQIFQGERLNLDSQQGC